MAASASSPFHRATDAQGFLCLAWPRQPSLRPGPALPAAYFGGRSADRCAWPSRSSPPVDDLWCGLFGGVGERRLADTAETLLPLGQEGVRQQACPLTDASALSDRNV